MATSSFFRDIVIKTEDEAMQLLKAMEEAEKIAKKRKRLKVKYRDVTDPEEIKEMFGRKDNE